MTGPIAEPPTAIPDVIAAAVKQVVEDPRALDLVWTLRLGTVVSSDPLYVIYDGDVEALLMVSMIGPVAADARVYAIMVPPAGNFIVGQVDVPFPILAMDANKTGVGIAATSTGGAEAAIPSANYSVEPTFVFEPGFVYEVMLSGLLIADFNTDICNIRCRAGAETTTGTLLYSAQRTTEGGTSGSTFNFFGHFVNSGSLTVLSKLSMTIIRVAGAGAVYLFGPLTLRVNRMGPISLLPGLADGAATV